MRRHTPYQIPLEEWQDDLYDETQNHETYIDEDKEEVDRFAVVPVRHRHQTVAGIDRLVSQARNSQQATTITGSRTRANVVTTGQKKSQKARKRISEQPADDEIYEVDASAAYDPRRGFPFDERPHMAARVLPVINEDLRSTSMGPVSRKQRPRLVEVDNDSKSVGSSLAGTPRSICSEEPGVHHTRPIIIAQSFPPPAPSASSGTVPPSAPNVIPDTMFGRLRTVISDYLFADNTKPNESRYGLCNLKEMRMIEKCKFVLSGDSYLSDPNIIYRSLVVLLFKLFVVYACFLLATGILVPWIRFQTCHFSLGNKCGRLDNTSGRTLYCSNSVAMFDPRIVSQGSEVVENDQNIGRGYGCQFEYSRFLRVSSSQTTSSSVGSDGQDVLSPEDARCFQELLAAEQMKTMSDNQVKNKFKCTSIGKPNSERSWISTWFNLT